MTAKKQSLLDKGVIINVSRISQLACWILSNIPRTSNRFCVSFSWLLGLCSGLHRNPDAAEQRKRQPGGSSVLRPRGRWLWHQLPTPHAGLCHEPLRAAGCCHVWLHKHARLGERRAGQGEIWTPASGGPGWWQFTRGKERAQHLLCVFSLCCCKFSSTYSNFFTYLN